MSASRPAGSLPALASRNFRLFLAGQLISLAGTWMQSVAQQWLVFTLTRSPTWLGIVSGVSALPAVLFALPGGHVADRYPRRTVLVITQSASLVLAAVLALLASERWVAVQPWHIAALAVLSGAVNAFTMPAQQALVPDMVENRAALGNAIALNSLLFNSARFLGPILAGLVLVRYGAAMCFGLNALSYLAVIAALLMLRLPRREPAAQKPSVWAGFRFIGGIPSVLRTVLMVGAASFLVWSISTLYPVLAARLGRDADGFTAIMAANGIGAATGGALVATIGGRFERRKLVYGAPVIFCLAFVAMSLTHHYLLALGEMFVAGAAMIVFGVSAQTKVQEEVSDALRGRVMAVYSLVFSGLMPLGGLLIGFGAEHLGAPVALQIQSGLCLVATAALYAWSRMQPGPQR